MKFLAQVARKYVVAKLLDRNAVKKLLEQGLTKKQIADEMGESLQDVARCIRDNYDLKKMENDLYKERKPPMRKGMVEWNDKRGATFKGPTNTQ